MDVSGAELLAREAVRLLKAGGGLYFHFMKDAPRQTLAKGGYLKTIGADHLFDQKNNAASAI